MPPLIIIAMETSPWAVVYSTGTIENERDSDDDDDDKQARTRGARMRKEEKKEKERERERERTRRSDNLPSIVEVAVRKAELAEEEPDLLIRPVQYGADSHHAWPAVVRHL